MNRFDSLKKLLLGGVLVSTLVLAGCKADGDGTVGPGTGVQDCEVPLGDLCLLGSDGSNPGLIDEQLLADDGALGPITDAIAPSRDVLVDSLNELLANDGDLASLVENLIAGGNVETGLAILLDGGMQDIIEDLVDPETLTDALGPDGVSGVIIGLVQDSGGVNCQAQLSSLCLIGGSGGQTGVIDALITSDGALADLADNLALDDLVGTLGDLLENDDGTIATLVEGLFAEGHLIEGLQVLLSPQVQGSLADALGDLLLGDGRDADLVDQLIDGLGGLLGVEGLIAPFSNVANCDAPLGAICLLGGTANEPGLIDSQLLESGGALDPIAEEIAPSRAVLVEALNELLANDADLANLVEQLLAGGNLQTGLAVLLDGGLQDIIEDLADPGTITDLLGPAGISGVITGLVQSSGGENCQAQISSLCLIGGNSGQTGLIDALITSDGALADLAQNLALDDLVGTLGDLLENDDGTIATLVEGLFADGHLVEGLQVLLNPTVQGSLADALGDLLTGQGRNALLITQLLEGLAGVIGLDLLP